MYAQDGYVFQEQPPAAGPDHQFQQHQPAGVVAGANWAYHLTALAQGFATFCQQATQTALGYVPSIFCGAALGLYYAQGPDLAWSFPQVTRWMGTTQTINVVSANIPTIVALLGHDLCFNDGDDQTGKQRLFQMLVFSGGYVAAKSLAAILPPSLILDLLPMAETLPIVMIGAVLYLIYRGKSYIQKRSEGRR